nr:amidohydrolase family protein [Kofleriaceae bacterium]
ALTEKEGLFEEAVPGAVGLETTLAVVLGLVAAGYLPLARAIDSLTAAPARAFALDAGALAIGGAADLCVVDPARAWTVGAAELVGKSKHTPLTGQPLVGRAVLTLLAGAITCDRDERLA